MKISKHSINITPLLDVILIIVFLFIINNALRGYIATENYNQKLMENEFELSQVQERLSKAIELNQDQSIIIDDNLKQIEALNKELQEVHSKNEQTVNEKLIQSNKDLEFENESLNEQINMLKSLGETTDLVIEALSQLFKMSKEEILELIEKSDTSNAGDLAEKLNSLKSDIDIAKEVTKMYTAFSKYHFIDVRVEGSNNRVFINDQDTGISMIVNELRDQKMRDSITAAIVDKIGQVLEGQKGGYDRTIVTLYGEESKILRAAYLLVWDSIKIVQDTYGSESISKMEFKY